MTFLSHTLLAVPAKVLRYGTMSAVHIEFRQNTRCVQIEPTLRSYIAHIALPHTLSYVKIKCKLQAERTEVEPS